MSATRHGRPAKDGLSLELWNATQYESYQSLHDPFVQGMAQGTLDRCECASCVSLRSSTCDRN